MLGIEDLAILRGGSIRYEEWELAALSLGAGVSSVVKHGIIRETSSLSESLASMGEGVLHGIIRVVDI